MQAAYTQLEGVFVIQKPCWEKKEDLGVYTSAIHTWTVLLDVQRLHPQISEIDGKHWAISKHETVEILEFSPKNKTSPRYVLEKLIFVEVVVLDWPT